MTGLKGGPGVVLSRLRRNRVRGTYGIGGLEGTGGASGDDQ